ncbi:hypothetical protein GCM10025868_01550 [Angustibacter aerolatus]|uniref:Pyrroline-5-carboxylate reductase catalytic N-terminal domain-containing protein n=1 Tax=Angustibacter aerolatus TaxID=1162965 RepID=A0ABQ6JCH8_9ACTN|nr:NAD(P)-binding domain-containing protein [Angustibacter aerolatus]GMA84905.1 hypothetical protein GCM10025868_01550 [Angustibacter aerolatus]
MQAGHDVVISNSRGPETLSDLVSSLGPKARAATAAEAAADAEVAVVTIPLKNIAEVPAEPLVGKLVIDTNNYYPERDGQIAEARRRDQHHRRACCSTTCRCRRS